MSSLGVVLTAALFTVYFETISEWDWIEAITLKTRQGQLNFKFHDYCKSILYSVLEVQSVNKDKESAYYRLHHESFHAVPVPVICYMWWLLLQLADEISCWNWIPVYSELLTVSQMATEASHSSDTWVHYSGIPLDDHELLQLHVYHWYSLNVHDHAKVDGFPSKVIICPNCQCGNFLWIREL